MKPTAELSPAVAWTCPRCESLNFTPCVETDSPMIIADGIVTSSHPMYGDPEEVRCAACGLNCETAAKVCPGDPDAGE